MRNGIRKAMEEQKPEDSELQESDVSRIAGGGVSLNVDGVKGEAQDAQYPHWIDIR